MLTKLQFQTLFGFNPIRRSASKTAKKTAKKAASNDNNKSASNDNNKVANKVANNVANKVGTRVIKGVKRTVYKGKNGGKFYKKSNGRKVYFGPAMAVAESLGVAKPVAIIGAKAIEGAGYTLGYKAANIGSSMLKKAYRKNKKDSAMGRKKIVAGKKHTVYKSATGAKYYKSAKGNKVYFGKKRKSSKKNTVYKSAKGNKVYFGKNNKLMKDIKNNQQTIINNQNDIKMQHKAMLDAGEIAARQVIRNTSFGKKRKSSKKNTSFGNHGYQGLDAMMGPAKIMFASHTPIF